MDWKEALTEIQEDGIRLGAGDYVDLEALEVAVLALEKQVPKNQHTKRHFTSALLAQVARMWLMNLK